MRLEIQSLAAALLMLFAGAPMGRADDAKQPPDFKEVYDLLRAHVPGLSEGELDRAAVKGLVGALGPKVSLVEDAAARGSKGAEAVNKYSVYDDSIAYVRVGRVGESLPKAVQEAVGQLAATNRLKGMVLDLRYADGEDYAAAAGVADLFAKSERPLLDWGNGVVRSKEKTNALTLPVAVLVNRQTARAAEALAAVLRQMSAGLLLGNRTAGEAMMAQDYPLKGGQHLRIATAPVLLGDGVALSEQGVKPDIAVEVSPQDERAYYADAYKDLANTDPGTTNQTNGERVASRRARLNEAELVRERKEGMPLSEAGLAPNRRTEPDVPLVQDPVLARALDVLKGLALVRQSRS